MKPQRLAACTNLVVNYEIDKDMEMRKAMRATKMDMQRFHSAEYVDFLDKVSPQNAESWECKFADFQIGDDWYVVLNPIFISIISVLYSMVFSTFARFTLAPQSRELSDSITKQRTLLSIGAEGYITPRR